MLKKVKNNRVIIAILLVCIMLVTELPRIINAAEVLTENNQEQTQEMTENAEGNTDNAAYAAQATPAGVDEFDPMYWMGQRTTSDTNRALVWFGKYWQDLNGTEKTPFLWRTLRSDDDNRHFPNCVTLIAESSPNVVWYDKDNNKYNQHWCSQDADIGSSDLRAWMNGVGTGAMDPDLPSRQTAMPYNEAGGGSDNIKGSFYANAFNSNEKNLILPTALEGETGTNNIKGASSVDKVFALSGYSDGDGREATDGFYMDRTGRMADATNLCRTTKTITEDGVWAVTSATGTSAGWWPRSPHGGIVDSNPYIHPDGTTNWTGLGYASLAARPAINLAPAAVIFTTASPNGSAPKDTYTDKETVMLEASNGKWEGAYGEGADEKPAYGQGATYRIFTRNNTPSDLGISEGSSNGKFRLSYPSGCAGEYINVLAVDTSDGSKWTGRVKKITDNSGGNVDISIPKRADAAEARSLRIFAWREIEETKTAYEPVYKDISLTEAEAYKISFQNGGGINGAVSMEDQMITKGGTAALRACTFRKNNSYFVEWQGADGTAYTDQQIITPDRDLNLTAIWSDSYNTVTYKSGSGSGADLEVKSATGRTITIREPGFTPPAGAEFMEWNTSADGSGTGYQPGDTLQLRENLVLFARYGVKGTVTYNGNGASEPNVQDNIYLDFTFTLRSEGFTKKGFTLTGWNTAANGSGTSYELGQNVSLSESSTLYAQWEAVPYKIVFHADDADQGTVPAEINLTYGDIAEIPDTSILKRKYIFNGWSTAADGTGTVYHKDDQITVDDSFPNTLNLYAVWTDADNYTLSYRLNKPAGVPASDVDGSMPPDDLTCYGDGINTETMAAKPGTKIRGYIFKGWSASALTPPLSPGLIEPDTMISVTADTILHAIWAPAEQWNVTYTGTTTGVTGAFPVDGEAYYDDSFSYKAVIKGNTQIRTGHTFLGWSLTENSDTAEYVAGDQIDLTGDVTLYAVWQPNTYTVKYDRNAPGGSGSVPQDQTGTFGQSFTAAAPPSDMKNPGKEFAGWKDGSGSSYNVGQAYNYTDNITLYAQWTNSSYQIVFDGNGAERGDPPASIGGSYGDTLELPDAGLHKRGYVFDGWSKSAGSPSVDYAVGAEITIDDIFTSTTLTLYAHWKAADTAKLSYDKNAGSDTVTGNLPVDTNYYKDGISNVLNVTNVVPVRSGYSFNGWSTTPEGVVEYASGDPITLTADTTLYAKWTEGTFSLTYHFNGGADPMYGELPATVNGTPTTTGITVAAQGDLRREHYKFTGWKDAGGSLYTIGDDITLTDNIDLYAQWQAIPEATLTYDGNCSNPETVVPSAEGGHYDDGIHHEATVTSDIPIRRGYIFHGWSTSSTALHTDPGLLKGGDTLTVTSDTTLYAVWELGVYTLKYDKNVNAADPNQVQGPWPDDVTGSITRPIAAHGGTGFTRAHYTFQEWNSAADGTGTTYTPGGDLYLAGDQTLYAIWEPESYTIQYDANGAAGTPPASQTGNYGTTFVAAQPDNLSNPGKSFVGWKDGSGNDYTAGMSYPFEKNVKLYAQWADQSWVIQFNINSADQGDPVSDITAGLNATVQLPQGTGMKKSKYVFNGWNTAPDGTSGTAYPAGGNFTVQESTPKTVILYASWKRADAYRVAYHKNGKAGSNITGNEPPQVTCYNDGINGSTVIPDHDLVYRGYRFMGWSETSGEGGAVQYHTGGTIDAAAEGRDIDLYAVWSRESYQLIYDKTDNNAVGPVPEPVTGSVEDHDLTAAPQGNLYLAKHKFVGWNTEPDYSGARVMPGDRFILDENKVLYAQWESVPALRVSYHGGCDTAAEDQMVAPTLPVDTNEYYEDGINGQAVISDVKPIRYGYVFQGWSPKPNDPSVPLLQGGDTSAMTRDLKLYAVWEMGRYTLTYHAGEMPSEVQGRMPLNKAGTITTPIQVADNTGFSRPYYTFTGWSTTVDGMGGDTYQPGGHISLGRDTTLYAQWKKTEYKIKFDLNSPAISQAQGTVPGPMSGTYRDKFRAPDPDDFQCDKYRFTGWNTDPDGEGEQFEPGQEYEYAELDSYGEEVTLFANWVSVPPYEIRYHKGEGDVTGEVPVDNNRYIPGTSTIRATVQGPGNLKRKGYEFVYWTTKPEDTGNNRYLEGTVFIVRSHMMFYAQWAPGTYTLTYNKNGSSVTGRAPDSIRSLSTEDITVAGQNTMKRKNYEFLGWAKKADAKTPDYKKGKKLRILEDTTVYAVWRKLINVSIEDTEGLKPVTNGNLSVSQGTKLGDLALPEVEEGYEIEGWLVNGQKVSNPKDYVLNEDAEVQAIVKKKPKEDKKDPPDNDSKDDNKNNKPDSGSDGSGDSSKGDSNTNGGSSTAGGGSANSGGGNQSDTASINKSKNTTKKAKGVALGDTSPIKKKDGNSGGIANGMQSLSGSESTSASANGLAETSGNAAKASAFLGLPWSHASECKMHFLILISMLLWLILTIFWRVRTMKKQEKDEEEGSIDKKRRSSLVFDSILPVLPICLSIIFYGYRQCPADLIMICIWLVMTAVNLLFMKRTFKTRFEKAKETV